jgi:MoaA/NifB/PqqE/SkfB family radical SAM enzyme
MCQTIGQQLNEFKFAGRVGFVGFGEPLLNKDLKDCVSAIKLACPSVRWLEVNTNGDFLTRDLVKDLIEHGCTDITVSMYDTDQSLHFNSMCKDLKVNLTLRHIYNSSQLNLIDRIGIVKQNYKDISRPCYMPFYKLFIDYNGDFLLCEQDWSRKTNRYNLQEINIQRFWSETIDEFRRPLVCGQRDKQEPCRCCDVDGTLLGEESFKFIADRLR